MTRGTGSLRLVSLVGLALLAGCSGMGSPTRMTDNDTMFGPSAMRIHPIFTQIKDWTNDGQPDGIEALIEFSDRFEDPTKAAGRVLFELYEYRRDSPDPRGKRLADPWVGSIVTLTEQKEHWSRTSGTYSFRLMYDPIRLDHNYVLQATFERTAGGRFFDKIILVGQSQEIKRVEPATLPGTAPSGRTPQP